MTAIHWFRRDLRLTDNPALLAAGATDDVVGLFVLDDALWRVSGDPRRAYLLASLAALTAATGGRLTIRRGDPVDVVPALAREVGATAVHVAEASEPRGRRRDTAVERTLAGLGVPLVRTGSPYAVTPGRLLNQSGQPFQVFTPFRAAWLEHGWRGPAPRADPTGWLVVPAPAGRRAELPAAPDLGGLELPAAGEHTALARWADVREHLLGDYAVERDRPDHDATSRLSTALKWGEVHPRTLLADLGRERGDGPTTFRSQLAWRDFHADVLHHHPSASSRSLRAVVPDDAWATGDVAARRTAAWTAGRTGYPLVDAGMRQLAGEGWMHNRVRMVVASFLVKDLHVPWQAGARHFMALLLDADVAQNQLNWQWVAGTGRDAAPYFRVFNPVLQGQRFDPDGDYVRRWVPELRGIPGGAVHEPWTLAPGAAPDYPERIVDHAAERRAALDAHARLRD